MSETRPPIPNSLKRELRQEAYFGCVFCGNPIIEYHHIEQYHLVKCHEKSNLVILCPEHHHRANCGEIFMEKVIKAKNNPYNKNSEFVSKEFFLKEYEKIKIIAGSVIFQNNNVLVEIDNNPLLTIRPDEDGYAMINAKFYDNKNNVVAFITNNEWKAYKEAKLWDITYSPGHLVIRSEKGRIFLEFKLMGESIELRANMSYNNKTVSFNPNEMNIGGIIFKDVIIKNVEKAFVLE
ncbi:HNH endonuclease [Clostridium sp. CF012]|uniref:HNH endonuclease signature motif containing protein n=1 Tax=Clostridium sp. CF012 TaxID=2843319 RepID=UPI001C0E5ADE|nr:HNH endonuclease [Clostridium sp. CF012]MBU3145405.1 HNH endonuclease [Clostridium sp. CF012]